MLIYQDNVRFNMTVGIVFFFLFSNKTRFQLILTGFECIQHETAEVGYCGHYSSTKFTDESYYHLPKKMSGHECHSVVKNGFIRRGAAEFKVGMNKISTMSNFDYGGIEYTSTNIACTSMVS